MHTYQAYFAVVALDNKFSVIVDGFALEFEAIPRRHFHILSFQISNGNDAGYVWLDTNELM